MLAEGVVAEVGVVAVTVEERRGRRGLIRFGGGGGRSDGRSGGDERGSHVVGAWLCVLIVGDCMN